MGQKVQKAWFKVACHMDLSGSQGQYITWRSKGHALIIQLHMSKIVFKDQLASN